MLLPLWPRRTFDFSAVSVGSTMELEVRDRLMLAPGMWGALALRVHASEFNGTTSTILVRVRNQNPSPREPDMTFAADVDVVVARVDDDTLAPSLLVVPVALPLGPAVRVVVEGTRTSSRPVMATLSGCLVLR